MLLSVQQLSLAYGPKSLFNDASFAIQPAARAALVGPNGSGKTTLFKIINGLAEADSVLLQKRGGVQFGYLPQEGIVLHDRSVIAEVEAAAHSVQQLKSQIAAAEADLNSLPHTHPDYPEILNRLAHYEQLLTDLDAHKLRSKAEKILFGLGFQASDLDRPCREFSGGWQMRIALARLLLEEPELLMMDEPTNHLDLDSLRWLESFLIHYPGAVLLISHDRTLLDQLTKQTLSIEAGKIVAYSGNYSSFLEQRIARQEQLESARKSQERKIAQTERFIERFRSKATKASQVQSRIKQLAKVERIQTEDQDSSIHFFFPVSRKGGHRVIELQDICKSFGAQRVFHNFSLRIEKGDRIGVVGLNGAGKSTLARILAEREPINSGSIELGHEIDRGYFAQDQSGELNLQDSVLTAASRDIRATETHIRSILGAFLFTKDDMAKPVHVLSGGEKNRLALARMLLQPSNFLILDEPTNHLDMTSKAVLQEALLAYEGTTFLVSHDRDFMNPVVNKILEIQPGSCRVFPGNLNDYLWKIDQMRAHAGERKSTGPTATAATPGNDASENPKERRRRQARLMETIAPLKKQQQQLEAQIAALEKKIQLRESEMADPTFFAQGNNSGNRVREYDNWKDDLNLLLETWTDICEQIEALADPDS